MGQRGEQRGIVDCRGALRPRCQAEMSQRGGAEGIAAEKQGFAAENFAGDGEAGERGFTIARHVVQTDDAFTQAPRLPLAAGLIDRHAGQKLKRAAGVLGEWCLHQTFPCPEMAKPRHGPGLLADLVIRT